jgi:hypothetical protein
VLTQRARWRFDARASELACFVEVTASMKKKLQFLSATILLAACVESPQAGDEGTGADDQNAENFYGPGQSCEQNVPLECEPISFTWNPPLSLVTNVRETRSASPPSSAVFVSANVMACQPAFAVLAGGVFAGSRALGSITGRVSDDQMSIVYSRLLGTECGFECDPDAALPNVGGQCSGGWPNSADDATVTIAGGTPKSVNLTGRVHNFKFDPITGEHTLTCSMSLEPSSVQVRRTRPNDVIGVDRGRFVRGYDLHGDARRQACSNIANLQCAGISNASDFTRCQEGETNLCVASFNKADPCDPAVPGPIGSPR